MQQLQGFRDTAHNNLLHCIIKTLTEKKDYFENFNDAINAYKPLITYLGSVNQILSEPN